MRCPACRAELLVAERDGLELDWCPFCRGLWLDSGELEAITATLGVRFAPLIGPREPGTRPCPRCRKTMDSLALRGQPPLRLDVCPEGHGWWFDAGELSALSARRGLGTAEDVVSFLGERLRRAP
ncbi:MAG: zf-TFIIB domain-containing protein [Thermoanaerobaculum sp.]|nr:zf-TFIIB domain-containing protein [Thermoanaerobaculum sp.]MDW7968592.1 zf-TFIIB domain-containing protein [Thermoanaerobaculum sp.]